MLLGKRPYAQGTQPCSLPHRLLVAVALMQSPRQAHQMWCISFLGFRLYTVGAQGSNLLCRS